MVSWQDYTLNDVRQIKCETKNDFDLTLTFNSMIFYSQAQGQFHLNFTEWLGLQKWKSLGRKIPNKPYQKVLTIYKLQIFIGFKLYTYLGGYYHDVAQSSRGGFQRSSLLIQLEIHSCLSPHTMTKFIDPTKNPFLFLSTHSDKVQLLSTIFRQIQQNSQD